MKNTNHIKMDFVCNQKWEHMKASENGRFCDRCKHEVVDFTNMSMERIRAVKAKNGSVCGHFRIEQVEDLTLIEFKTFKKVRYWFATLTTFLGLELGKAHAQHYRPEVKCEITGRCNDSTNTIHVKKANPASEESVCSKDPTDRSIYHPETGKKKYYLTKGFPFIVKRRQHVSGVVGRFL